jgi:hypothetical protein
VRGGVLEEDYTWSFSTLDPAVLEVSPAKGASMVGPTDPISITFNQPMDHVSVQTRFSVTAGGKPVAGTFRWLGGQTPIAAETMVFQPSSPLPRDTKLQATLAPGAQARAGGTDVVEMTTWPFATVKAPGVLSLTPKEGAKNVAVDDPVRITFASPMQIEGFLDHLRISPQVTPVYTYWQDVDTVVALSFKRQPATAYTIQLDASTPDKYGAGLGKPLAWHFTTGNLTPFAVLNTTSRLATFSVYTDTVVYATYRNVTQLTLGLYRLSLDEFMQLNGLGEYDDWDHYKPAQGSLVRTWSVAVKPPRNRAATTAVPLLDAAGKPLPAGLYYLTLSGPEVEKLRNASPSRCMFVKSGVNLTLKQTTAEAMVWATDLGSGQPVSGLAVTFHSKAGIAGSPGTTDADGLYMAGDAAVADLWEPFFAVAGQPGDERFAIAYNGWDEGITPWNFSVESEFWTNKYQAYVYTDRPIYRPGQTVYFKGILRADDDARYSVPSNVKSVQIVINDPDGKELFKKSLALSEMGTLYDQLKLGEEAPLGYYYIELSDPVLQIYQGASFQVAEYRKPEYQVSVKTDRDAYLAGDSMAVNAEATYYFGGAVSNAPLHWNVLSSDYWFSYECPAGQTCPWYDWTDYEWGSYEDEQSYGGYGRLIASGDGQTDDQGRSTFSVPADISRQKTSQLFTVEASITDVNGQQVSSRTAAVVHKGEFYIGLAARGYLAKVGEQKQVDVLTVDWNSGPVGGVPLTVVFMEHRWYSVRRQAEDGNYYWDWLPQDVPVYTTTVTTGVDGKAVVSFAPAMAGSYRVRAIGRDAKGNEIRSSTYFWVWGGGEYVSWRQESNNRIDLIADKKDYQVGDTAEILVASPYSGTVQALVTVERGHVLSTEVRELKGNSEVLRVPIVEAHVPDVFVSVVIVEGSKQAPDHLATFKMGLIKLPVSIETKELTIALKPDKDMAQGEHYGPRQSATYDVLVTDSAGKPVQAELSLRLADLAVLALADESGPSLVNTFWRDRGLGVKTSLGLTVAMEPYNRELVPGLKGGGGGEEEGGLVRSQFADTAFWEPAVQTGADGKAQVTVALPDNLTTWRMQARGVTAETLVGTANVDILSSLDLLVRPVLPRFFVVGDQARLATIVHNNTADPLNAEVQIAVEGLQVQGDTSQSVAVPAGGQAQVTWPVTVLPGDKATVRTWASAGSLYDGREDTLPVYPYSTPEVVATAGRLSTAGTQQEVVQLPPAFDPTQGGLTVQVDGSLTAATQDALTYLEQYPYECVEQTVSRFLPNVVTYQALDEMGLERPDLRQKLSQMVGLALQKLYAEQHYDGGWGWWVTDESDLYLTAYALQGMIEARRADFVVDEGVMARAAGFVFDHLPSVGQVNTTWRANRLAYALYVLAEFQALDPAAKRAPAELGLAISLFGKRHLLDLYGQALLAAALHLLEPDAPQRMNTLLNDLEGSAVMSATGTHWEEREPDYRNMNTDVRTTAIVLWALSRLSPKNELLPNAVRWLMSVRKEGHWESTNVTAWSLLSLVEYMRASGEMEGDFSYAVYLNGVEAASGTVTKETIDESHKLTVDIAQLLVDEGNRLVIDRQAPVGGQTGKGQLYYSTALKYYLPAEQVTALDRGIVVARQYSPVDQPKQYVTGAQVGDVIQVRITIIAPTDLYYVVVEDPLPAGCEGVDLSLKTTSVVGEAPELTNLSAQQQDRWLYEQGWGWWWFSNSEMRDEKVVLFATYLPRGTYEYTYLMRASLPGEFRVLPTTAYEMYFPEVFGRSDGGKFSIK